MAEFKGKSNYFGDRPMPIAGRMEEERERLAGMTMEEREWRAKWCKDQELAPDEPKFIPDLEKKFTNPIGRLLWRRPVNFIFYDVLEPIVGPHVAHVSRHLITKGALLYLGICCLWYTLKYREGTWEREGGWIHRWAKSPILPGDPGYPHRPEIPKAVFGSRNFYQRDIFLDVGIDGTSSRTTKG